MDSSFGLLVKLLGLARNLLDLYGAFRRYSEISEDWKKSVLAYIISFLTSLQHDEIVLRRNTLAH